MWPPEWWTSDYGAGEEVILEDVQYYQDLKLECIHIVASHLDSVRKGIIILENPAHLKALYHKLKDNLGKPLTMIGDIDLDLLPAFSGQKQATSRYPFLHRAVKKT